jgi:hypothetical protein
MGDYLRVRPYSGTGLIEGSDLNIGPLWVGSGYTIMKAPSTNARYVQPFYYIFGVEGGDGNMFDDDPYVRMFIQYVEYLIPLHYILSKFSTRAFDVLYGTTRLCFGQLKNQ